MMFIERLVRAFARARRDARPPGRDPRAFPTLRWCLPVLLIASGPAWADPGVRVGAHGGVDFGDATDPHAGVDLRLSFSRSPLTISPTFDYVFDDKMTLYKVSVNALYYFAVPLEHIDPYVGIGFDVTAFSFKQSEPGPESPSGGDSNGNRLGMNLVAGMCFDLRVVSPFVQVIQEIGELHPLSLGAGLVVALDRDRRWNGCGRRAP